MLTLILRVPVYALHPPKRRVLLRYLKVYFPTRGDRLFISASMIASKVIVNNTDVPEYSGVGHVPAAGGQLAGVRYAKRHTRVYWQNMR